MNILDVGCGAGSNLYYLKTIGFKNLFGIDKFIENDIYYSSGLKIEKKSIYEVDRKMDLIIFNHSLEHMPDPIKIFHHISKLLKKNGVCLISIPIIPSFAWEHTRRCSKPLAVPATGQAGFRAEKKLKPWAVDAI